MARLGRAAPQSAPRRRGARKIREIRVGVAALRCPATLGDIAAIDVAETDAADAAILERLDDGRRAGERRARALQRHTVP